MMKGKVKVISLIGIMLLGVVLLLGTSAMVRAAQQEIPIGAIFHLTGPYAAGQAGFDKGWMDSIEAANKYMDLKGAKIVGTVMDGGTDVSKSMAAFKNLAGESKPIVCLNGAMTPVALALKTWLPKRKIPMIEVGADDEMAVLPSWIFSTNPAYVSILAGWVDYYMKEIWPKKGESRAPRFSWFTWDNAFGRSTIKPKAKKYIESKGVEVMGEEYFPFAPTDASAQWMRLKEKKADFTYGVGYHTTINALLTEGEKLGMLDQVTLGFSAVLPIPLLQLAKEKTKNTYLAEPQRRWLYLEDWEKECPRVYEMYKKNKRETIDLTPYEGGFKNGLIACEAVRLAITKVGPQKVTGEDVYAALQTITNFDCWRLAQAYTWNATKRFGADTVFINKFGQDKVINLGEVPAPSLD
jgi:ABC-type branched-subunit amino acid transport system substrate-binding protein